MMFINNDSLFRGFLNLFRRDLFEDFLVKCDSSVLDVMEAFNSQFRLKNHSTNYPNEIENP
jgi:hypothetical protein